MRIGAVLSHFKSFANRVSDAFHHRIQHNPPSKTTTTSSTTNTAGTILLNGSSPVLHGYLYDPNCLDLDAPYLLGFA